jgi:hypothetical protein
MNGRRVVALGAGARLAQGPPPGVLDGPPAPRRGRAVEVMVDAGSLTIASLCRLCRVDRDALR